MCFWLFPLTFVFMYVHIFFSFSRLRTNLTRLPVARNELVTIKTNYEQIYPIHDRSKLFNWTLKSRRNSLLNFSVSLYSRIIQAVTLQYLWYPELLRNDHMKLLQHLIWKEMCNINNPIFPLIVGLEDFPTVCFFVIYRIADRI